MFVYCMCTRIRAYVHAQVRLCVCMWLYLCARVYICVCVLVHMRNCSMCVHVYMNVDMCILVHACVRAYHRGGGLRVSAGQGWRAPPGLCQRLPGCGKVRVSPGLLPENSGAAR